MDWNHLKYFIILAREKTLQKAASAVESNPSTVFRRIKAFEEEIGTKLFERTSEGYSLSSAGEALYLEALEIEEKIEIISRKIHGLDNQLRGEVILTTTDTLALTVLPQIIKDFSQLHPNLKLDIRISSQFFNLSKREADIALRPSSTPPDHLLGRKLGKFSFAVYASTDYLSQHPVEDFLKELGQHSLIGANQFLSHLESKKWLDKMAQWEAHAVSADNLMAIGNLCTIGMGIAILPTYFEKYFPALRKIHVPHDFKGTDLWLLTHKDFKNLSRIKVTLDFFQEKTVGTLGRYLEG